MDWSKDEVKGYKPPVSQLPSSVAPQPYNIALTPDASGNDRSGNDPVADIDDDANDDADDGVDDDADDIDEDSGVKRWVVNEAPKPRKISEKKRADAAAFDRWIEQNQESLAKARDKNSLDDYKSVGYLVKDSENRKIIASPRDYQLELFEVAKTQNTIAVLDTGSGKTLIAALLLRWTIENELEDRAQGRPKRIAFFLVDKVALVFQQHAVLTCNLDYPIEKLCGEIADTIGSKESWMKLLDENMAIVCTAEILNFCLHSAYIRMDQINLLVFDEAHHTKKNHPYARIIKDFYTKVDSDSRRPRILGMTASPVDAQVDPRMAAAELEALLHSRIATAADPTMLQSTICKPKNEVVRQYERRQSDWETPLAKSLRELVGGHELFQKAFAFGSTAAAELGPWIADRFWQLLFRSEELQKMESKIERQYAFDEIMGRAKNKVREACELVKNHKFTQPAEDKSHLSGKVLELLKILQSQFQDEGTDKRCIVFVKQRNTAMLLADLLRQPEMSIPRLRVGVLVGGGATGSGFDSKKVSYRDQVLAILKFKRGELNCIFATSVAEEGLDIPDCNVIIRFDLYDTLIQYIQSRGRARQEGSTYYHMIEKNNSNHYRKVQQNKMHEEALRKFCQAMPEDRKLTGHNYDMNYFLRKERNQRQYTIPETGAKLTYKQSLVVLATFVSSLPHSPEVTLCAEYVITTSPEGGFQCEVMLPSASPVRSATGKVHSSKAVAKCSAAFEMCLSLIQGRYLDKHLKPVFTKQLPAMRNARLGISSKKKGEYGMRVKPEVWSSLGEPTELYAMALTLVSPEALGRPSCPLLLLTRQPMPQVAAFSLFFGGGRSTRVVCVPISGHITVESQHTQALATFTLRVFEDVFSKEYESTPADLPYFLAPASTDHSFNYTTATEIGQIIDWDTIKLVQSKAKYDYEFTEPDAFFTDKYVIDPYDGSRKFFLHQRRYDLKPRDPVPEGVPSPGHRAWIKCDTKDILNWSISLWSASRAKRQFRDDQPVVEAELLPIRRNLLDDTAGDNDLVPKQCFLVLETMKISVLPPHVVAMAYNFPAIIHRIDSNLIALDACRALKLDNIRPDLALEAFTKDSDNTDEHDNPDKINFQAGMGNNYERLEFLGDTFLKMSTTIAIYTLIPDKDEFAYHVERMCLVCNRNLFNNALEVKLEEYIRSMSFNRRTWYPEGLNLKKGKRTDTGTRRHMLADKSIADVCEALIGAAYLTGKEKEEGASAMDMAIQAVTAVVKDKKHLMQTWRDYYAAYVPPAWQTAELREAHKDLSAKIAARTGYVFKHPRLLRSALLHPTCPFIWEGVPNYQRLEFLGDALLDMVCVDYLFHAFPGADPQWLTEHKMAMVSNQFLGCLAVHPSLEFHNYLKHTSPAITTEISEYVTEMDEALRAAKKEAVKAGKPEELFARNFWVHCSRPPKCLPDVVEAYIGAVFVDSGYDFNTVREFFDAHVKPWFEDMRLYDTFANKHPVTFLSTKMKGTFHCGEWRVLTKDIADGQGLGDNTDELESILGGKETKVVCGVSIHGRVVAHAVSASGRYGKIAAAKEANKLLEGMSVEEFRKEFGCDCVPAGSTAPVMKDADGDVDMHRSVSSMAEEETLEEHGTAI